ncbi:MAG: DUF2304 domain-containing protein [Myxococcota bacterium]
MKLQLFQTLAALGSIGLTTIVLELIRRGKLQDELWVPWLLLAVTPLLASLWMTPWATLARWLGIAYEPALLLALGILLAMGMILYLTVVLSTLMRRNLRLVQELAVLQQQVEQLAEGAAGASRPRA